MFSTVFTMNFAGRRTALSETVVTGLSRMIAAGVIVFHVLDTKTLRIPAHMMPPSPYAKEEIAYYTAHPGGRPVGARGAHPARAGHDSALSARHYFLPNTSPRYADCFHFFLNLVRLDKKCDSTKMKSEMALARNVEQAPPLLPVWEGTAHGSGSPWRPCAGRAHGRGKRFLQATLKGD